MLETGHEINKAKPLFKKIEDKVIEAQKEKLYKNLETQENESKDDKKDDKKSKESKDEGEKMDLISIDEFAKVEIKIGKILECEKIEKSNKLLRTQIDIGDKTIQVIAGLGKRYAPEDLVGSEGMIMATESAAILTPDDCEIGELLM